MTVNYYRQCTSGGNNYKILQIIYMNLYIIINVSSLRFHGCSQPEKKSCYHLHTDASQAYDAKVFDKLL